MGILRLIFAVAVVFSHCWPGGIKFVGGSNAVRLFYMISGFLISYILVEKKSYPSVGRFYLNRYLRLYPAYIFVAAIALILVATMGSFAIYRQLPIGASALLAFANAFIVGQDWIMFTAIRHGAVVFPTNFLNSEIVVSDGLLLPQAWTLGVELSFYAIAPFILTRRYLLWAALALSCAVKFYLVYIMKVGNAGAWNYRFFPAELMLFLIGALSHQIGLPLYRRLKPQRLKRVAKVGTFLFAGLCIVYFLIPVPEDIKMPALLALFAVVLPLTFIFQDMSRADQRIGEISYPVYVGHVLVIGLVTYALSSHVTNLRLLALICVVLSIVFGIALDFLICRPFEKIRRRVRQKRSKA